MQRRALIVAGAAGSEEEAIGLLRRFGFASIVHSDTVASALEQLAGAHFDLVVLPVYEISAEELATLERIVRQDRYTFVIGTAPQANPEIILRAMRAGVHEFLTSPPDAREFTAAVDRLQRRVQVERRQGQVIAVHSAKGGLGTTSIAVNLAAALASNRRDARVALADLVVTGGDVRVFLNLSNAYHMGDLASKIDRVDADLMNSILTPTASGVWTLPGPDSPEADESLDAAVITQIIDALRSNFGFTVLDCEHHLTERTVAAMDAADRILLVTQLTIPGLRSTQRSLTLCRRLGYPEEKICVVVSRHHSSDILSTEDAVKALNCEIFWKLPNDYGPSSEALTRGVPVAEVAPGSKLTWSYGQLATKLGGVADSKHPNGKRNTDPPSLRRLFGMKRRS